LKTSNSYHDISVIINGKEHKISNNFAYQLNCSKCGGLALWWIWDGEETQIASEFSDGQFQMKVGDKIVFDNGNKPIKNDVEISGGWNGWVQNGG